jgi:hypothetical protein
MKNTLALSVILIGGMLVYGGYKDYTFADTLRFFTGQKLKGNGTPLKITTPPLPQGGTNPDGSKAGPPPPGVTPRLTPGPGGVSS